MSGLGITWVRMNEFVELPVGVSVRVTSKERFWFNYSPKVQTNPVGYLKPGGVFIESLKTG